ncbi:MAG: AMP-binding protein [Candidatus Omnitrophota bacterium]
MNIAQIIIKENQKHLNRNAVIDGDKVLTYAQLLKSVDKTRRKLKKQGVVRFNRVALLCEDSADYIIMSLAVLALSAVVVPVPLGSTQDEIDTLLKDLKVNFIIFQRDSYPGKTAQAIAELGLLISQLKIKGRINPEFYKINPAFIRFSSGTTGTNKGVVLSHKSIIQRTTAANRGLKIKPGEQIIWVLSMSFHFVVTILLFLRRSATIIISSRNFPQELLGNLKKHPATFIYASPLHYHLLCCLNIPKKSLAKVRLAVSTAIKLPTGIAERFRRKFGFPLAESYGIIEMGLPFTNTSGKLAKRGSVGKLLLGYKIKILNPDAQGVGEIYLKGQGMFEAYFYPWQSRKETLVNGWFNTGDLGRLDKDGYLFILGRHKQLINFSGMKIFPFEIESLLNTHPLVKESLVYGRKHPEYGQLPVAKIILKNKDAALNPQDLRKFCYQHLAAYKVPKEFEFVVDLPKTVSGKLKIVV